MKGYINCRIHGRKETAFLVEDGKFLTFGTDQQIEEQLGWQDETIDCHGMYAMPGFIAGGLHLLERGRGGSAIHLDDLHTFAEVKAELEKHQDLDRIVAFGYRPDLFEGELERTVLDEISAEKPIVIYAADHNLAVLNSKALEAADPDLDSEENGDRGILVNKGMAYLYDYLTTSDLKEIREVFLKGCEGLSSNGITTAVSDDFHVMTPDYKPVLTVLEQLAYQQKLPFKVIEDGTFRSTKEYASFLDEGYTEFVEDYNLMMGRMKIKADGALLSHTAALREPYQDKKEVYGILHYIDDEMTMMTTLANRFNTGTVYEAVGDGAVDQVLDIVEDTIYENNPLKDTLTPCALLSKDHVRRIIQDHLACALDPSWLRKEKKLSDQMVAAEIRANLCPYHTLYENVPVMGLAPEGQVLQAVEDAVCRPDDEKLSLDEALSLYTDKAAETLMIDDHTGKMKEDYDADFIILEQDPHEVKPEEIHNIRVMISEVRGETVFER